MEKNCAYLKKKKKKRNNYRCLDANMCNFLKLRFRFCIRVNEKKLFSISFSFYSTNLRIGPPTARASLLILLGLNLTQSIKKILNLS